MLGRTEQLFKWTLYGVGILICCLLHGLLLQHLTIFGVMPFIYPILAAVIAMYEGPFSGSICGIALGILCDLTIAVPIPCFHTLIFPVASMLAGLISKNWLPISFFCAMVLSSLSFLLTDTFRFLLLTLLGHGLPGIALSLAVREACASLLFVFPILLLFRYIYNVCHMYD